MPKVTKINSGKGLVEFKRADLIDLDLTKWIRADSKGYGKRDFISVQPIEKAAAKLYKEKYPSEQVKIAEKCFINHEGEVAVVLRVANEVSEGYYKHHPTKLTFLGDVKAKEEMIPQTTFEESMEDKKASSKGLTMPIDFLEANIDKLSVEERRQIFAELGKESAETFLEDLKLTLIGSSPLEKIAEELTFASFYDEDDEDEYYLQ
jgi:hypothetical protein